MRVALLPLLACVAAACGAKPPPSNRKPPEAGISIALYRQDQLSYGIVDDRRWVEISGSSILLGNIDPGAALASLVIETTNPDVRIGPCTRERLPDIRDSQDKDELSRYEQEQLRRARLRSRVPTGRRYHRPVPEVRRSHQAVERFAPIVQCDVAAKPGRYLVRIVYVSNALAYRVHHELELRDPEKATLESRFVMQTPHWRVSDRAGAAPEAQRAEVVLFDGVPGGLEPPKEITRGIVTLDGGTSVLIVPAREVPTQLRRVFEGVGFDDDAEYDADYMAVWATLELPDVELAPGPIRVHVAYDGEDERYIDVPVQPKRDRFAEETDDAEADTKKAGEPQRIKLWIDSTLRGARQRAVVENDGVRMIEVVTLSMTNYSETPREVWLEEHARPAKRRQIERAWPKKPSAKGDKIRNKVTVKPGRIERVGYTIVYEM